MKRFCKLYSQIDAATSTKRKQSALQLFFQDALRNPSRGDDAAWAVYFLAGGKPRQSVPSKTLRQLALAVTGLPEWLFEECYQSVGDLAETLALLLPAPEREDDVALSVWMKDRLPALRSMSETERLDTLKSWLAAMPVDQRLVFFKLITGSFRVGVSNRNVVAALASVTGVDERDMARRMMGYTQSGRTPHAKDFAALTSGAGADKDNWRPYPFFLAHPLQAPVEQLTALLGSPLGWLIEWKFDGIRAQYIRRGSDWRLWSRGEELVNEYYPDLAVLADWIPEGTALDGEIVVVAPQDISLASYRDISGIAPFAKMQKRIGRKTLGAKLLRDLPVAFIAYDLLEIEGRDIREAPQAERRSLLERFVDGVHQHASALGARFPLRLSPALHGKSWPSLYALRESARNIGVEGLMLKSRAATYGVGRRKGEGGAHWWKWKLDPMSMDAVMIYAQRGHGRRSGVYSDYTFALWDGEGDARTLVPFAKAYSGLTDAEMREVDAIIRKTTIENYGPVRSLKPTMVFELGFEGVAASTRHKSGVSVRFPRMLRWRKDKPVEEADTLASLRALAQGGA